MNEKLLTSNLQTKPTEGPYFVRAEVVEGKRVLRIYTQRYGFVLAQLEPDDPEMRATAELMAASWAKYWDEQQSPAETGVNEGVKCTHCNGMGCTEQHYDEEKGWSDNEECTTCGATGRIRTVEQYLKTLPANWHEDSSLETWFPLAAEEHARYKKALQTANGFLIMNNLEPVKLEYAQETSESRLISMAPHGEPGLTGSPSSEKASVEPLDLQAVVEKVQDERPKPFGWRDFVDGG